MRHTCARIKIWSSCQWVLVWEPKFKLVSHWTDFCPLLLCSRRKYIYASCVWSASGALSLAHAWGERSRGAPSAQHPTSLLGATARTRRGVRVWVSVGNRKRVGNAGPSGGCQFVRSRPGRLLLLRLRQVLRLCQLGLHHVAFRNRQNRRICELYWYSICVAVTFIKIFIMQRVIFNANSLLSSSFYKWILPTQKNLTFEKFINTTIRRFLIILALGKINQRHKIVTLTLES